MKQQIKIIRHFNREYFNLLNIFDTKFNANFTITETRLLYELSLKKNTTLKELCSKLHLDFGYVSRIIKRYSEQEYISKKEDEKDKRTKYLNLTEKGKQIVKQINLIEDERIRKILENLSSTNQEVFSNSINKALEQLISEKKMIPIIRTHKPGDLGMITHFHGKYYAEKYDYSGIFEALVAKDFSEYILNFDTKKDIFYVVEQNGIIMGSLALQHRSNTSAQARFFYLDPSLRGQGIGKALMSNILNFAKEKGYNHIDLWTHKELHTAHSLYRKFGFKLVKTKIHSLWKENLEEQLWEKKI